MENARTLVDFLDGTAARYPDRIAVSAVRGLRVEARTYADLRASALRFAGHLRVGLGYPAGARIVVHAPNSPDLVAALFGILRAGLIAVPLDAGSSDAFIERVVARTGAIAIVTSGGRRRLPDLPAIDLDGRPADGAAPFTAHEPSPEDVAEIVFTSGTTGDPKGVVLTHRNIVSDVLAITTTVPPEVPQRLISILPLSHMLEQTAGLFLPVCCGGSVHYPASVQPLAVLRDMRRIRPSGMVVVPRFLQMLGRTLERAAGPDGHGTVPAARRVLAARLPIDARRALFPGLHRSLGGAFRFFLCGGARLPAEAAAIWEGCGIRVVEGYGATECAPVIASNTYNDRRHGTVGRAVAGVRLRLSDDGELQVSGPTVTSGYWQDPERTAAAFTGDGWFRTGDVADIDRTGVVTLRSRLGDRLVLASGMKVYPEDIEDALRRFPAVRDCAVVARPDAAGHDQVHAVIIPRDETSGEAGIAEAVRSANRTLGSHQQITGHTLWTAGDFPRTNLGKVKRREVGEVVSAGRRPTEARSTVPAADPGDPVGRARGLLVTVLPEPAPPIQAGSDLVDDLGLDSLGRVELMTVVEQRLGIELDEAQLGSVRTVAELEALLDAGQGAAEPGGLVRWPRTTASGGIRKALQAGLVLPAHGALTTSFEVSGIDRLRKARPPVLLIANHSSHVDTLSIIRALPPELRRKTAIAAASDYFYANPVVGGLSSLVLNTFPFSRAGAVRDSFERCGMLVDQGWSVLVYPEGTRSPTGALLPFKNGIGLLARGLRLPVVPIAVTGGRDILPKNARLPRRAPVSVRFGDPITIDPNRSPGEITAMLEGAVAALLAETKASSRPDVQGRSARDDRSAV